MVTQKPISLKIDAAVLDELDQELSLGWIKRNKAINEAVRMWLDYKDTKRRVGCFKDPGIKAELREQFFLRWFSRN